MGNTLPQTSCRTRASDRRSAVSKGCTVMEARKGLLGTGWVATGAMKPAGGGKDASLMVMEGVKLRRRGSFTPEREVS